MPDRPELTAIAAAQDRLAELLRKRPGVPKAVPIDVGWPASGPKATHIWIDGVIEDWDQAWTTTGQAGPAGIDETFPLVVNIKASRRDRGARYATARDAALALLLELQQLLREDHTLEGVLQLATIVGGRWSEGVDEGGGGARHMLIEVRIACTAYLTTDAS